MAMAPSSPRLPSPPPPAEIQIGPNSPSGGPAATLQTTEMEQSLLDANSMRRIHPGTKAADMAAGPPLVPLNELESAFSLQEHLAALHHHHTASGTRAVTRATALQIAQPPPGIDRTLWLYELCRFLISQCNTLIVGFLFDTPPCSASTCPEMRASEWQFLCAVHEQPKSCCAIDYCCHTLDWAANVVSDQKIFPSRFVILNDTHSKNVGLKNLVNVFRRLHRIFAHAWFQHRSVFWSIESQSGLYVLFKTVCDLYDLLPAENYKLPPEAEGLEAQPTETEAARQAPTILKPTSPQQAASEDSLHPPGRTTTRRHVRSSPSTGSAVTTVVEAEEEETDAVTRGMNNIQLSATEGEPEVAEVPVIVEDSMVDKSSKATPDVNDEDDGTENTPHEPVSAETTVTVVGIDGDEEADTADTSVVEIAAADSGTSQSKDEKGDTDAGNTTTADSKELGESAESSEKNSESTEQSSTVNESSEGGESSTTDPAAANDQQTDDSGSK